MRVSVGTREKWLRAFGAELPEAIRPFAEDEQEVEVTNGGMFARCHHDDEDLSFKVLKEHARAAGNLRYNEAGIVMNMDASCAHCYATEWRSCIIGTVKMWSKEDVLRTLHRLTQRRK